MYTCIHVYLYTHICITLGEYKRLVTGLIEKTENKTEQNSMKNSEIMDEFSDVEKSAVVNEQIKRYIYICLYKYT
jgi:hypothetical protein